MALSRGPYRRRRQAYFLSLASLTVGLSVQVVQAAGPFTYSGQTGSPFAPSTGVFTGGFDGVSATNSSANELDFLDLGSTGYIATDDTSGSAFSLANLKLGNNTANTDVIAGVNTASLLLASSGSLTQNGSGAFNITLPVGLQGATFSGVGTGAVNFTNTLTGVSTAAIIFNGFNTTTFSGSNSFGSTPTTINSGTLALDYTNQANSKIGTGALAMGAAGLNIIGNASTSVTQTVGALNLTGGLSTINIISGNTSLSLGTVTRSTGAAVNFINASPSATITTTSSNLESGILAEYAVYNGTTWATVTGGVISGLTTYGGTNADETSSNSGPGNVDTIRFNTAADVDITGTGDTLDFKGTYCGILMTPNVGANNDSIAYLKGDGGDLYVHQFDTQGILTLGTLDTSTSNSYRLVKDGPGTVVLSHNGSGSASALVLNGGLIQTPYTADIPGTPAFDGGGISLSANSLTVSNSATVNAAGGTLDIGSTFTGTFSGAFSPGSGGGGLTKTGAGTIILSGANTYTGPTIISAGTLQSGATGSSTAGPFGTKSAVTIANTAGTALYLNNYNTTLGSITGGGSNGGNVLLGSAQLTIGTDNTSPAPYAGIISSTTNGKLVKTGNGYLNLTGVNAYNGGTTISGGVLLANNSTQSLGTGATTISGGVLAGTGATGGPVTVSGPGGANGVGTISAGSGATSNDTIGTLQTGTQTWSSGGIYAAKVGNSGTSDELVMGGLVFPSNATFTIQVTGTPGTVFTPNESWLIADVVGGSSGVFNVGSLAITATGSALPVASKFKLSEGPVNDSNGSGEGLELLYTGTTATPEPGSAMILAVVAYPLLSRRRRRA